MHLWTALFTRGFIPPAIFTQNFCPLGYEIIINNRIARNVNQGLVKKFDFKFGSIKAYFNKKQNNN